MTISENSFSQANKIDSLKKALLKPATDTAEIDILNELSYCFYMYFPNNERLDSCHKYAREALAFSQKINYPKGEAHALINMGCYYADDFKLAIADSFISAASKIANRINNKKLIGLTWHGFAGIAWYKGDFKNAFDKYNKAIRFYKEAGETYLEMLVLRAFTFIYYTLGNYSEGLKYTYTAIKYFEKIKDTVLAIDCYQNLSGLNYEQKDYQEALRNNLKCIEYREKSNDWSGLSTSYNTNGDIYLKLGNLDQSLSNYFKVINLYQKVNNEKLFPELWLSWCYSGIGNVYEAEGDSLYAAGKEEDAGRKYNDAVKYYKRSFRLVKDMPMGREEAAAEQTNYIGGIYIKLNRLSLAREYLMRSLAISSKIDAKRSLRDSYLNLSKLYRRMGDYKQAYLYNQSYFLYRDSLLNEESLRKSSGYKILYEFEKKEDEVKLAESEVKLHATVAKSQRQQKEFAFAGIAVILLAGGYGFYRYRYKKKIENQQEVLNERLRISSELHDEVGATLSGIAMYSHLTKEQMRSGQTKEIEKSLNIMQQSSAQMVNKLSDIVWLINPEQDSLQKLIVRLEEYATDMAAIKNMQVKIKIPEKVAEINLPVESRRNIYLFCKEAINNAVKYSNATLLELTVKEVDGKLQFSVSDNGRGFDAVMVRRGNGLENMQKRADEMGAKLVLQSKENEGVSVSLQCKIT